MVLYPLLYDLHFPVVCLDCIHSCLYNWTCICGSPDQIAVFFLIQVVHIKTAVSLAFESSFPFDK